MQNASLVIRSNKGSMFYTSTLSQVESGIKPTLNRSEVSVLKSGSHSGLFHCTTKIRKVWRPQILYQQRGCEYYSHLFKGVFIFTRDKTQLSLSQHNRVIFNFSCKMSTFVFFSYVIWGFKFLIVDKLDERHIFVQTMFRAWNKGHLPALMSWIYITRLSFKFKFALLACQLLPKHVVQCLQCENNNSKYKKEGKQIALYYSKHILYFIIY